MAFALQLRESLDQRQSQLESEFASGADLTTILTRHLAAVESAAETELLTSILLLDESGRHLRHAAGPSLPRAYCDAIDGGEIGPSAGSCGTAAFLGHPIYVTDIESDPLWADYRVVALQHGLRACWSTPIFNDAGSVIGTFAIYHLTPRSPTVDEVKAIALIADHVADAITLADKITVREIAEPSTAKVSLSLVAGSKQDWCDVQAARDVTRLQERLLECTSKLVHLADSLESGELADRVQAVATDCRALVDFLGGQRIRSH
jgi:hypothetical protein